MNTPPGWSYNPSSWRERIPIVILAMVGFGIASWLTLYQVGILPTIWEPFFGNGSEVVLNSSISTLLPIPDAALGALGYLLDAVTGVVGGTRRWKTQPWVVILFGLAVGPFGGISVLLVITQPVVLGAWCTLCLSSALISVLMVGPAMDELLASLQYLTQRRAAGESVWRTFWGVNAREQVPG